MSLLPPMPSHAYGSVLDWEHYRHDLKGTAPQAVLYERFKKEVGMNPVQAAIRRILAQHYGGNWNDPRAQRWGSAMAQNPPVAQGQAGPFRQWLQTSMLSQ